MREAGYPHVIWLLWLQGWESAPATAQACLMSWRRFNPDWQINALDKHNLSAALNKEALARIFAHEKEPEAISDQVRIELLHRWGGVWADATAMCSQPLNHWLPGRMSTGFFAFDKPAPDRMLASWFLVAVRGSYIVDRWRECVIDYWRDRTTRDDYFWFHRLFSTQYSSDPEFKTLWDSTPTLPARHAFHFAPEDARLIAPATRDDSERLRAPAAPVFKLTHKLSQPIAEGSLLDVLLRFGRGEVNP